MLWLGLSSVGAWACGISWSLPATPFANDGSYQFRYWESLGTVKVDDKLEIPLQLGFNPATSYVSPILRLGWTLPLFESRIEQVDDKTYLMKLPDGHEESLRTTEKANILHGAGWLGEIKGRQITCKASCGWQMIFQDGRLRQMRSPDGAPLVFSHDADGTRQMSVRGQALVTLKPDWDKETTEKVYRLDLLKEMIFLKIGMRTVVNATTGAIENRESLCDVVKDNGISQRKKLYFWTEG